MLNEMPNSNNVMRIANNVNLPTMSTQQLLMVAI